MTRSLLSHVSSQDRNVVRLFKDTPGRKIGALALELGLRVIEEDGRPDEFAGQLEHEPIYGTPSGWVIKVNENHPETRKRFTVAHELGHYFLHKENFGRQLFDDYAKRHSEMDWLYTNEERLFEREANIFAAWLLVDDHALAKQIRVLGRDARKLAAKFWVSERMMEFRLMRLGGT